MFRCLLPLSRRRAIDAEAITLLREVDDPVEAYTLARKLMKLARTRNERALEILYAGAAKRISKVAGVRFGMKEWDETREFTPTHRIEGDRIIRIPKRPTV